MSRVKALAEFLNVEEVEASSYEEALLVVEYDEYLVLTDEEADEKAKEQILDSVWAFNISFLKDYLKVYVSDALESSLCKLQRDLCEDANEILIALIDDIDEFVQGAIDSDGRGHFLSHYDGEEVEQGEYFIYRLN